VEAVIRPVLRAKSITTKVTEEECASLERLAAAAGKNMSEWCREVLLERAKAADRSEPVMLAELLALRTILLNLFYALSRQEPITADGIEEIIQRADSNKLDKALERLNGTIEVTTI
jgi:hypothetical protein